MVEKDVKEILRGLKIKARKGSTSDIKLLVHLAELNEQKPEAKPDNEGCMAILQDLASQPEYQEPEEDTVSTVDSRSGQVQSAQSAAEGPSTP